MRSPALPTFFARSGPIARSLGLALALTIAVPAAVQAAPSTDYRCTALRDQAVTAAAHATDPAQQQRAQRFLATGDQLCAQRAEGQAARQYRAALSLMGVAELRDALPAQVAAR